MQKKQAGSQNNFLEHLESLVKHDQKIINALKVNNQFNLTSVNHLELGTAINHKAR